LNFFQLLEDRLNELSKKVNKMNEKKHFAVPELIEKVEELVVRFNSLHEPLERLRAELDESMGWHQLAFDVDVELQWIGVNIIFFILKIFKFIILF